MPMVRKSSPDVPRDGGWWPKWHHLSTSFHPVGFSRIGPRIAIVRMDVADETLILADPDTVRIPDNLDGTVGGRLAAIQSKLDGWNLPSAWVQVGHTFRFVLRRITAMLLVMQRIQGSLPAGERTTLLFVGGRTLNTAIRDLTAAQRDVVLNALRDLNIDRAGLTLDSTIGQVFARAMPWFENQQIHMGPPTARV